jgi:hypothetical protein
LVTLFQTWKKVMDFQHNRGKLRTLFFVRSFLLKVYAIFFRTDINFSYNGAWIYRDYDI